MTGSPTAGRPERNGGGAPAGRALRRRVAALAGLGPWLPLTRDELVAAVPAGSRRARSQSDYLATCAREPALADVRADRAENLMEFARVMARYASWADRSTRPTRARVCSEAGFRSVTTYKQCRRWWEQRGYLGTVRAGYTPHLRPGSLADPGDPNEAAVYVLCCPQKTRSGTRRDRPNPITRPLTVNAPRAATTREAPHCSERKSRPGLGPSLTLGTRFRRHVDVLRIGNRQTISEARAAWIARRFARAGWTPADVAFALNHHPVNGRYRSGLGDASNAGASLFWRLSRWLTDADRAWSHYVATGQLSAEFAPIASASQLAAERAERDAARRRQLAAERAERATIATGPSAAWRAARATLQDRRRSRQ